MTLKLMTPSMFQFQLGNSQFYDDRDGFHHDFNGNRFTANRVVISCIACGANKDWPYSEIQTPENELIAVEAAHWQMNHREKCKIPVGAVEIK